MDAYSQYPRPIEMKPHQCLVNLTYFSFKHTLGSHFNMYMYNHLAVMLIGSLSISEVLK